MTHQENDEPPKLRRLLRKEPAKALFGSVPDSTWYLWIKQGIVPRPLKVGTLRRSIALWDADELAIAQQRMVAEREERTAARAAGRGAEEIYAEVQPAPVAAAPEAVPVEARAPPLTPAKAARSERNRRIAARWDQGWTKQRIAQEEGMSVERVRQLLAKPGTGARDREIA
jgi:hypothetical protein